MKIDDYSRAYFVTENDVSYIRIGRGCWYRDYGMALEPEYNDEEKLEAEFLKTVVDFRF